MAFVEIEQKYKLKSPSKTRVLLRKLGARKIAAGVEENEFYDRGALLKRQKVALRLRRFGKGPATLTLKGPKVRSRFTKRMEIETPVDYAAAKALLAFLGFCRMRQYSKKRELYRCGQAMVTLDRLKGFGWFLEIEGRVQEIRRLEAKLRLDRTDREERSYLHMLFHWKH